MMSGNPRSREHTRLVERILALAESYGATNMDALGEDVNVIVRVEYLAFRRAIRSAEERVRRKAARGTKMPTAPTR